jgi:hypothetical protein
LSPFGQEDSASVDADFLQRRDQKKLRKKNPVSKVCYATMISNEMPHSIHNWTALVPAVFDA